MMIRDKRYGYFFRAYSAISMITCILFMVLPDKILAQQDAYLIEAESFQFKGKWYVEKHRDCFAGGMLRVKGGGSKEASADAMTLVNILEGGNYAVWVRSADFKEQPGTRLFRVSVDGKDMELAGRHGVEGFAWEKVGHVELERKKVLLRLHDTKRNFARCDAILLLKDDKIDPNQVERIQIGKWRVNPYITETTQTDYENISPYLPISENAPVLAQIENKNIRISFVRGGAGNKAILCKTEINVGGQWKQYLSLEEDHKLLLIKAGQNQISHANFFPSWEQSTLSQFFEYEGNSIELDNAQNKMNPYGAGKLNEAIPVMADRLDERTIEVQYLTKDGSNIIGYWQVPEDGSHINVSFTARLADEGMYSMSLSAFKGIDESQVSNVLLPPMFQYRRISENPQMLLSTMMQQPLTIVETEADTGKLSAFICADLSSFTADWGNSFYAPIGFSLHNADQKIQPVAFSPVLGMEDSKVEKGDVLQSHFILGALPGGWDETMAYVSEEIFKVSDYRKQTEGSLTDALFNITDLMSNNEAGGWSDDLKGFYDIEGNPETAPTVVHATPLAVVAGAIISHDEDLYLKRALPTIEYTLSRSGYRWAQDIVPTGYNRTAESLKFNPFKSQFNTSYFEGLNTLLGNLNPWLKEIALPGDTLRKTVGYSVPTLPWVQAMSAYRLTRQKKWLDEAKADVVRYIDHQIYTNSSTPLSTMPFYNTTFYAPWWDLIDLYEETNDISYLKAAQYGAAHTLAGIRSYPQVGDSLMTIHPGNRYEGNTNLWWKGKEKYRLGFPRKEGDVLEHKVPTELVSPVGLGFEQAWTYFLTAKDKEVRPVFMSSWAPHLLRLHQHTQQPIYQTYARNSIIGRFTNYPGYYATGYTDITMREDFPYKGPDVSSIYYHHIPPHWAFVWDYLVTEAIQRSGGNIDFPYGKQEGFVWFANRIYHGTGRVFDDKNARIWMKKGLIELNSPKVNYITAISDKHLWVILNSESWTDEEVTVTVNTQAELKLSSSAFIYAESGEKDMVKGEGVRYNVTIPTKGIRALAIPISGSMTSPSGSPLEKGMQVVDLGKELGKAYLFRIRSPFGWDSIYGYAESGPSKNASFRIVCNGEEKEVNQYPFESSFYKLAADQPIHIEVSGTVEGRTIGTKEVLFK